MTNAVPRHRRRIATATTMTAVAAFVTAGVALAAPSNADSGSATLAGSTPAYATASADLGQTGTAATLSVRVYLTGQDQAGLAAFARAVSDPSSPTYKHYLSAAQVQQRFGASQKQIDQVSTWLKSAGLTVAGSNTHWIDVTGTVAAAQKAFGTQLHNYRTSDGTLRAPQSDAKIPSALSSVILGVTGLSQTSTHAVTNHQTDPLTAKKGPVSNNDPSCSDYYAQKKAPSTTPAVPSGYTTPATLAQCSLVPSELRQAYGVSSTGLTGKGATIAIVNWYGSPTMQADANQYAVNHGDKPFAPGQYSEVNDPSQYTNQAACGFGDYGEESLDVDMAHGLAPDAKVITVAANSCFDSDLIAAEAKIVDNHLADIVSNSWGEIMYSTGGDMTQAQMQAYDQVFMEGAAEGIAFDFSSGDCMNNDAYSISKGLNCDPTSSRAQVEWPTSSSWVTSVGGTALALNKQGGYGFEAPMGDNRSGRTAPGATSWVPAGETFGGGGGVSESIAQPWYQSWTVPNSESTTLMSGAKASQPMRTIPDISLNGDLYFSSTLVGQTTNGAYGEAGYGGTSVSAPSWAGILADAQQAQYGVPVGFANPAIYARSFLTNDVVQSPKQISGSPTHSVVFQYPASSGPGIAGQYRLIQYGVDEGLPAARGYDEATGVGSPNAWFLRSFGFGH
ncbi:S53 family peptidase [Catenulispora pinisilvae]|uniref:S53 family peptidase n=1 Tax=Catenulispora pinisilvae TaxID=2705253 RepID=UPI001891D75C|nr:S53 family peptidase [Catenulispora pinisilvae]